MKLKLPQSKEDTGGFLEKLVNDRKTEFKTLSSSLSSASTYQKVVAQSQMELWLPSSGLGKRE